MFEFLKDKDIQKKIISFSVSGIIVLLAYFLIINMPGFVEWLIRTVKLFSPFLYGIILAYIINPLYQKLKNRSKKSYASILYAIISVGLEVVFLLLLTFIIIPQLIQTISSLSSFISNYLNSSALSSLINSLHLSNELSKTLLDSLTQFFKDFLTFINNSIPAIFAALKSAFNTISNLMFGFVIAIYLLIDQEKIIETLKMLFSKYLKASHYKSVVKLLKVSIEKFTKFFTGKIFTSAIMGLICFPILLLFKVPYPSLLALIIAITNILPIFGPITGTVLTTLIVLIIDPFKALLVLILNGVIQVADGNILGPKVLGDSVGLSSFLTFSSILIGGRLFGFWGILLGVPVVSIIYYFIKEKREV